MSSRGLSYALGAGVKDPVAKLALMAVCDCEQDGTSTVSLQYVGNWCCGNEDIADEALWDLELKGLITTEKVDGNNDDVIVTIHELVVQGEYHRGQSDNIPPSVRRKVYLRDGDVCNYCREPVDDWDRTLDHVIPRSRGGEHTEENLVVCCRSCNSSKGARTPEEWCKT